MILLDLLNKTNDFIKMIKFFGETYDYFAKTDKIAIKICDF